MIPNNTAMFPNAKFGILEEGDVMLETDEYYNNFSDRWMPVEPQFVGLEWSADESKPVRRKL